MFHTEALQELLPNWQGLNPSLMSFHGYWHAQLQDNHFSTLEIYLKPSSIFESQKIIKKTVQDDSKLL